MNKTISKEQLVNYINYHINDFQDTINLKCYFTLGIDARELLGTVRMAHRLGILNDTETYIYTEKIVHFLVIAESNEHRSF